jgi:hypothetical protein
MRVLATTEGALIASANRGARAISEAGGATSELLQDAMSVVANATQGVAPSPQAALHTPEARTFWLSRVDPEGSCFELEIARFQAAVVEELDPDGGWT